MVLHDYAYERASVTLTDELFPPMGGRVMDSSMTLAYWLMQI